MSDDLDEFIQLDRTFHDLALSEEEGKDAELFRLMRREKPAEWRDLLAEPRVVLLSEAGSGKTEEIRHCLPRSPATRAARLLPPHRAPSVRF